MRVLKIFIVEDEKITARMLQHYLSMNEDNDVAVFHNGRECLANLSRNPDVICLDYYLPGENGEEILKKIKLRAPDLPVIIVSGQEEINTAVNLLKMGAYDYVVKDENMKERIWNIVNHIRKQENLHQRISILQEEVEKKYEFSNTIVGNSSALRKTFPLIEKAAKSDIPVSISGQTGTGKEVIAKTIHYNSHRKDKLFVPVNVGAIPGGLIESELFGHEKGAFTGAIERRAGKFEEAQGGTLFLDEIGDMELNMQVKLLRVLQEQQLTRVGSNTLINLDVRIIIATHKNLLELVSKGQFREDLYYRLLGISIHLPPLHERGNDILVLARHFIKEYCQGRNIPPKKLTKPAIDKIMSHRFPGNIRELKALVELGVVLADQEEIEEDHIQIIYPDFPSEMLSRELTMEEYNLMIVKHFLKKHNNKVRLVAGKLGIGKSTIYRMLADHGIDAGPQDNDEENDQ